MKYLNRTNPKKLRGVALLRLDFNTEDDWRMRAVLPTIKFLLRFADKIVILSHRGRPSFVKTSEGKPIGFDKKFSLKKDASRLQIFLKRKVRFIPHFNFPKIKKLTSAAPSGSVFILENLRFLKGEEKNDKKFAKQLSLLGDYYVNDAFAVSHRENASVCAIAKFLPSFAGLELERELKFLSKVMRKPEKPLTIILGGAKASDKLGILQYFKNKADWFLLGGVPANTLLMLRGVDVEKSIVDYNPKNTENLGEMLRWKNMILPTDWKMGDEMILDIGSGTAKYFVKKIKSSRTIIWNGPMGLFEKKPFNRGTFAIARAIVKNRKAFSLTGGGETVAFLKKYKLDKKFSFISTGGGAMLEFLAGKRLPGIEALNSQ